MLKMVLHWVDVEQIPVEQPYQSSVRFDEAQCGDGIPIQWKSKLEGPAGFTLVWIRLCLYSVNSGENDLQSGIAKLKL